MDVRLIVEALGWKTWWVCDWVESEASRVVWCRCMRGLVMEKNVVFSFVVDGDGKVL